MPVAAWLSLLLVLNLLFLSAATRGNDEIIKIELSAGIGGHAVFGHLSEVQIRLFSSLPFTGTLNITDAIGHTKIPVQLDEYQEKVVWAAVSPLSHTPVKIKLITSQAKIIEKEILFDMKRIPLTIISNTVPLKLSLQKKHQQIDSIIPVVLAAEQLPHISQAYSAIDAFITDRKSLSQLSDKQYLALGDYLSRCGVLLLLTNDQNLLERLQNMSGCRGEFVQSFSTLSEVTPSLLSLHTERPPKSPRLQDLMLLQKKTFKQQMLISLSLYLVTYVLLMALMTWQVRKTNYLLVLPLVVAGSGVLAWSGQGSYQLISWAETTSGDIYSRVSSLLLLGGDRLGNTIINLENETHFFNPKQILQYPEIQFEEYKAQHTITVQTQLLSPQTYLLSSIDSIVVPFTLKLVDNYPQVIYQGDIFPQNPRLLWRGNSYPIPVLKKGKKWQPDMAQAQPPATAEERLLNRRLSFNNPALLIPLIPVQTAIDSRVQKSSWLVIRHDTTEL